MKIGFSEKYVAKLSMEDYVQEIVDAWDKVNLKEDANGFEIVSSKCNKNAKISAAPEELFKVNEDAEKLVPLQAMAFHNIVAKALYLVKRARSDASMAIAFLTT